MPTSPRPTSRTVLSPTSRRLVAGLLVAAGALLCIAFSLRLYVLLYNWHTLGVLAGGPLVRVLAGLVAGALVSYLGWRVGLHQPTAPRR